MGFTTQLTHRGTFEYRATDESSGLTEHEIDHVFMGRYESEPSLNPSEASDWQWIDLQSLADLVLRQPERFTPWFPIALAELSEYQAAASSIQKIAR